MKTLSLVSRICCFVCVALMLALIVVQFVPNWSYEKKVKLEDGSSEMVLTDVSLGGFTWFPSDHKTLTTQWNDEIKALAEKDLALTGGREKFKTNNLVGLPILSMFAAAAGIFFCLVKNKVWAFALLPMVSGGALAYAAMTHPVLQWGTQCQTFQLLGIVTLAVGTVALVTGIVASVMGFMAAKKVEEK